MTITVVVVAVLATIGVGGSLLTVLAPPLMATGALMPFIGYTFGYIISLVFSRKSTKSQHFYFYLSVTYK